MDNKNSEDKEIKRDYSNDPRLHGPGVYNFIDPRLRPPAAAAAAAAPPPEALEHNNSIYNETELLRRQSEFYDSNIGRLMNRIRNASEFRALPQYIQDAYNTIMDEPRAREQLYYQVVGMGQLALSTIISIFFSQWLLDGTLHVSFHRNKYKQD